MAKLIYKYLLILLPAALFQPAWAQDPTFSQFYSSTMFHNPSLAADGQETNFVIANRSFTNSNFSNYRLTQFTGNYQFKLKPPVYGSRNKFDQNSGLAVSAYQESSGAGILSTVGMMATAAHSLQISKAHYAALGLQFGFAQKKFNNDLNWGSQYVPGVGYQEELPGYLQDGAAKGYVVFSAGAMWFYMPSKLRSYMRKNNFDAFAGISVYNINAPDISMTGNKARLPLNLKVNGGMKFSASPQVHFFPNFVYMRQNANNHLNIGFYTTINPGTAAYTKKNRLSIIAGAWYRLADAIVPLIGAGMYDFKLLLSYDINASRFAYQKRGRGAAEITLKYSIIENKQKYTRGLLYPSF
jgi:type IX secretion system PorP/SprF family membrane protein